MAFEVAEENPFDFILEARASEFPFGYDDREKSALRPYLEPEESERWRVLDWTRDMLGDSTEGRETISFLTELNQAIHRSIELYRQASTRDPGYAYPVLGLAKAYAVLPFYTGHRLVDIRKNGSL